MRLGLALKLALAALCMVAFWVIWDGIPVGGFRDSFTDISGVVVAGDGTPIDGVQITLESAGLQRSPTSVVNKGNGEFRFAQVSKPGPRPLKLTFSKPGYVTTTTLLKTNRKERLRIVLKP